MTVTVHTRGSVLAEQSKAARVLHPYSVAEAEADPWQLDRTRQAALAVIHRCEYLLGDDT